MMNMKLGKNIKVTLSIILVTFFVWFFLVEFKENWASFRTLQLEINWAYLVLGVFAMIANYLCTTLGWHIGIKGLNGEKELSFDESVSLVNISQLGKYIPGKIWSYVVQIYWLSSKGFPKASVLYLNILATLLSVLVSLALGCIMLAMLPAWHDFTGRLIPLVISIIVANLTLFSRSFLIHAAGLFSRITGKEILFYPLSSYRILSMELTYITGAFFWVLAGCFISLGIGFNLENMRILFISSAMLLGDVIGFLILLAPGGLGVREGTMYWILKGDGVIQFALIFPVVVRLLSIITDLIMGAVSVLLLSRRENYFRKKKCD
jgi:glycosyltransferase 2 family protein